MLPIIAIIAAGWILSLALMTRNRLLGAAVASVFGVAVSLYLGVQHHPSAGESFCSVDSVFNCDTVNRSQWSEVAGIPIALLGAGFYGAMAAVSALGLRSPQSYPRVGTLLTLGGAIGVALSVFLAWASLQLGAWCLFCISLYGVNAILLAAGLWQDKASEEPFGARVSGLFVGKDGSLGPAVGAGLLVFVASMFFYNGLGKGGAPGTAAAPGSSGKDLSAMFMTAAAPLELDGTEPVLGDPAAPYTIVEFADFECPYCGKVAPELVELQRSNPKIKFLFKNYPISDVCNDQVEGARHENACNAAYAGECARQQGRFWQLDEMMFKNQEFLAPADILFMADQLKLDKTAFANCLRDPRTVAAIKADVAAAAKVKVMGTPAIFMHGLAGDTWVQVNGFGDEIRALIAAKEAGTLPPPPPWSDPH